MLRLLRWFLRRFGEETVPAPDSLDILHNEVLQRAFVLGRIGYHLRVRVESGERIVTREQAFNTAEFDRIIMSIPIFTEPMFLEDGTEVDPREFY